MGAPTAWRCRTNGISLGRMFHVATSGSPRGGSDVFCCFGTEAGADPDYARVTRQPKGPPVGR